MPKEIIAYHSKIKHLLKTDSYHDTSGIILSILNKCAFYNTFLITRPPLMGKSLTNLLLKEFFSKHDNDCKTKYFKDLAIWKENNAVVQQHYRKYTVIHISFAIRQKNFLSAVNSLILEVFEIHSKRLKRSDLYHRLLTGAASENDLINSLAYLTEVLKKAGKKSIILIDEYDWAIHNAQSPEQRKLITYFIQQFIHASCNNNPHIKFAVIMGLYKIAGLSNKIYYSGLVSEDISSDPMYSQIGFTEEHVKKLINKFNIAPEELDNLKNWYGFESNGTYIFRPYSILKYIETKNYTETAPRIFHSDTLTSIRQASLKELIVLMQLFRDEHVYTRVASAVDFEKPFDSAIFFNKLVSEGFLLLGPTKRVKDDLIGLVKIPNKELYQYMVEEVMYVFLNGNSKLKTACNDLFFKTSPILESIRCLSLKKRCESLVNEAFWDSLIFYRQSEEANEKFAELIDYIKEQMQTLFTDYPLESVATKEFQIQLLNFLKSQQRNYLPLQKASSMTDNPHLFMTPKEEKKEDIFANSSQVFST